ncbi:signal-transducing adaptor protein 1-like [Anoplopoma fimbria]|uniref:signal-transducing adaptor protein 1-like n=1 Tax=Anoplopoma fimbria TaxID=229290 RepID=UPI0023EB62A8|nr:signal-transducing adaptor protein 1-like [Anoplopoma fimbria]
MVKLTARQRSQLPTCYYEGYLEKRSFKDKTSRKLWTCLCGNTLFFFNEKKNAEYIEKVDLSELVSISDDRSQDCNLDAARLNLILKHEIVKITAPNAEARELWKGFIHSVAELSVPASLNLLPGQIHMLKEAVEKEKTRISCITPLAVTKNSAEDSLQKEPACFHRVSRLDAELLLDREVKRGNLLLRPGSDGSSYAVTTRQDLEGSVMRHYRVTPKQDEGFIIDVDNPVSCATLHDVINYLVENTDGVLIPLIIEDAYEKNLSFIRKDRENGERSVQQAPLNLTPPNLVLPNLDPPSLPTKRDAPRIPTPEPAPSPIHRNFYLNDIPEDKIEPEDLSAASLPQLDIKAQKKSMMPPVPAPRKLLPSNSTNRDQRRGLTEPRGQIPQAAISELKLKFGQMALC